METKAKPFNERKMKMLHDHLLRCDAEGKPRYYEIKVDDVKAVLRTNDPKQFDNYLDAMDENSEFLEVIIYNTHPKSFNAERHKFRLQEEEKQEEKSLSGIDIDAKIEAAVVQERRRLEFEKTQKDLSQTQEELKVAQDYIEELENQLKAFQGKKLQWGNVNLGELASVVVEGIVRRNPQVIAQLPGGEALAGIIIEDNKATKNGKQEESEVTFSKAKESQQEFSEDQLRFLKVLELLEENFEENELSLINSILEKLIQKPEDLKTIASLLGIS